MKPNEMPQKLKIGLVIVGIFIGFKLLSSLFHTDASLQIVHSAKVRRGDLKITVTATGEVKPYNRVEIKPPIAGRVEEVLVQEGDKIHQGQVLAWMSSTERAALLDAARSQGEEIYKRWQTSYKPAPLMAPLEGTVIVRAVEPGQTVTTADPVVVISDRLIVEALVDETDLSQIKLAQKTEIRLDAYPNKVIPGKVDHISYESKLVNNVNVYAIDVITENIPLAFRSGMTANVTFLVADHKNALLVPSEAIAEWPKDVKRPKGAEFAAYKKDFGKLVPVPVRIGESDGRMTEIISGLTEGATVQMVRKRQSQTGAAFSPWGQRGAQKGRS